MMTETNAPTLPTLFVSHGAPSLAIERNATVAFLRELGAQLARPRAILCVSAHWNTPVPAVSAAEQPETIYDFGGFAPELYRMRYPAPGAPWLAERVAALLAAAGMTAQVAPTRGLDHGAWVPLSLIYPAADVQVTQLSVQPQAGPAAHFHLGRTLAPLRREGVLIIATGSATHNLARLASDGTPPPAWAVEFDEWLYEQITGGALAELLNYRQLAPHAALAHPTEEHLLPLFVALGAGAAGEQVRGRALHRGWTHGSLSMASYAFGAEQP
ncbi:MAG TPA: class III extradiol ring-cleavage dioxygenase [Pyrinomonadaceae bacterium]|jgi:4,5-DOPA dioxygenase extradiol